jgi:hypothetical protein
MRRAPRHGMAAGALEKLSPRTRKFQKDPVRAFRYLNAGRDDKAMTLFIRKIRKIIRKMTLFMRLFDNEELADELCAFGSSSLSNRCINRVLALSSLPAFR